MNSAGGWIVQALSTGGFANGEARAVSADGSVVGGVRVAGPVSDPLRGFVWTQPTGMLSVNQYAALHGLDLTGWLFTEVRALSADGLTLAVRGADPSGVYAGYVIQLPAPGAAAGLIALAPLWARRRRGLSGGPTAPR